MPFTTSGMEEVTKQWWLCTNPMKVVPTQSTENLCMNMHKVHRLELSQRGACANISDINSQCSCIHSPNKDLGVEKGRFLQLRVLFLSIFFSFIYSFHNTIIRNFVQKNWQGVQFPICCRMSIFGNWTLKWVQCCGMESWQVFPITHLSQKLIVNGMYGMLERYPCFKITCSS
jgi:hypothetical protein